LPNLARGICELQIVGVQGNARASACLERRLQDLEGFRASAFQVCPLANLLSEIGNFVFEEK
jgi:hypothetical protein